MERIRTQDNNVATIKWCGKLADSRGNEDDWFGVEWDDPKRGKHSGEYKGKKLFDVSVPGSGSFVRASTVKRGIKISDIISNYSFAGGYLSLDSTDVQYVGEFKEFPDSVKHVNVAYTLVGSSQFIWDLLRVGPKIESLTLGRVHFVEFPATEETFDLKEIVLNDTNITEEQLLVLTKALPHLKSIDISFTSIRDFSILRNLKELEEVKLHGLDIDNFDSLIDKLSGLQNIKILSLNNNKIAKVSYKAGNLETLTTLFLNSNQISAIYDLDPISNYKELRELRVQRNPLQEKEGEVDARLLTIGRFPFLLKLNGSEISSNERRDSEISYLTHFANEVYLNGSDNHPRWKELVEKYGEPAVTCIKKEEPKGINVILEYDGNEETQFLMPTITIEKVTQIAQNIFDLEDEELDLILQYKEYITKLSYPDQTLEDVGCIEGSVIHVRKEGEGEDLLNERKLAMNFRLRSRAAYARGGL